MQLKYKLMLASMILLITFPTAAFAEGYIEKKVGDSIAYILNLIFKPIFDFLLTALSAMMTTPELDKLPVIGEMMTVAQYLASSLLVLTFTFRLWRFQTGTVYGGQTEPLPDLIYRTCWSGVLIYGLPEILKILIRLNNVFIEMIQYRGINFTSGLKALIFPTTGNLVLLITMIIFVVSLIALTFSNAVRIAELCLLYIFAPILAVSYAGKGESFQIWVTQAIAVSLTQCVQYLMVSIALNFTLNIDINAWYSWIAPIGAVVVAIRGPQLLKQFLYNSGVGGFAGGMAQSAASSAIYMKMMRPK